MLEHWLWLATRPGVSDRLKQSLIERFGDAEEVYFAPGGAYATVEGVGAEQAEALRDKNLTHVWEILHRCKQKGIRLLPCGSESYPPRLRQIGNPPAVLYALGTLPEWDARPAVALVGTRKASAYGQSIARRIGLQAAQCGAIVVSGGAEGIDTCALEGALQAQGTAVAVLGCGVDVVYPKKNAALFAKIRENGCILSEFPPGTPPTARHFPMRNRVISGICSGVAVVEAPAKSGSLITAHLAAEQGRDVFVVPGNIDVDTFAGSTALLREGAIPIRSGWDILEEYAAQYPETVRPVDDESAPPEPQRAAKRPPEPEPEPPKAPASPTPAKAAQPRVRYSLTQGEREIVDQLAAPMLLDDLIACSRLPAAQVLALLTILEIKGIVKRLPGKYIALK